MGVSLKGLLTLIMKISDSTGNAVPGFYRMIRLLVKKGIRTEDMSYSPNRKAETQEAGEL